MMEIMIVIMKYNNKIFYDYPLYKQFLYKFKFFQNKFIILSKSKN